jgi:hypothetical protein
MPEAVTRPLRPIQNHSSSACGWRARRYWSIALPVLLPNGSARSRPPLPVMITTSYSKFTSPTHVPAISARRPPLSSSNRISAVSRRASNSWSAPARSTPRAEGVELLDGLQVGLDRAGGLALGAQVALEGGREVYAGGCPTAKRTARLCAVGPLC